MAAQSNSQNAKKEPSVSSIAKQDALSEIRTIFEKERNADLKQFLPTLRLDPPQKVPRIDDQVRLAIKSDVAESMATFQKFPIEDAKLALTDFENEIVAKSNTLLERAANIRGLLNERKQANQDHWSQVFFGKKNRGWRLAWACLFSALALVYWFVHRRQWRKSVLGAQHAILRKPPFRAALLLMIAATIIFSVVYVDVAYFPISQNTAGSSAQTTLPKDDVKYLEDYAKKREGWVASAKEYFKSWNRSIDGEVELWDALHQKLPWIAASIHGQQKVLEASNKDLKEWQELDAEAKNPSYSLSMLVGFALSILLLSGGIGMLVSANSRRRKREKTCPLCLDEKLQNSADSSTGKASFKECKNLLQGASCDFRFPKSYASYEKLYFPTIGVVQSGKTFWSAMTYNELLKGNYASDISFSPVRSNQTDDARRIVNEVIDEKQTEGTQDNRIPFPLIFNFKDRDLWTRSNVLVNIFDYTGEIVNSKSFDDAQRNRALRADGYFYFIDPLLTSDRQLQALADFKEDADLIARENGKPLDAPVAICISKIDLFPISRAGNCDEVRAFYDSLMDIDPTGKMISLKAIERRHTEMAKLVQVLWGDWNIENSIREVFGNRYRFFPLTPVGLEQLGNKDLTERQMIPRFIVDPLIWLLHMNGFPVFRK